MAAILSTQEGMLFLIGVNCGITTRRWGQERRWLIKIWEFCI